MAILNDHTFNGYEIRDRIGQVRLVLVADNRYGGEHPDKTTTYDDSRSLSIASSEGCSPEEAHPGSSGESSTALLIHPCHST